MGKPTLALTDIFLDSFAALPKTIQGKVTEFISKFRNNPDLPGINLHPVEDAADDKIYSVRIDLTYRGILASQPNGDSVTYLLLWVDHHDEAYKWARSKKCEVNKTTGSIQIYDVASIEAEAPLPLPEKSFYANYSDQDLLSIGVPEQQINFVRGFRNINELLAAKNKLPMDAYEGLEWIGHGYDLKELFEINSTQPQPMTASFADALKNPISQRSFVIIDGEEELRKIMAEPLEKWRIFLHPAQRKIVERNASGPIRVLGGAETGKTVAAMHRAKWLVEHLPADKKIFFTTYTVNLANDIRDQLRKLCSINEMHRIDVLNLDAWAFQYLQEHEYQYKIIYDKEFQTNMEEAISLSGVSVPYTTGFIMDEWQKIVVPQETFTKEQYLKAPRIGRGTRLDRKARLNLWEVFDSYQNLMRERKQRDVDTAMVECRKLMESQHDQGLYESVIVDESQDMSVSALRLLRTIAGSEHANDMFIVGDTHQRIYKNMAVLSKCGINVRGRSSHLRINYCTTEETRRYAFHLLEGLTFDDLDGENESKDHCQSLTHGEKPIVKNFISDEKEFQYILQQIEELESEGINLKNICVVAHTHNLLDKLIEKCNNANVRTYEIRASKVDDRTEDGIRIATMHRVKGLEFPYVFITGVNKNIVPYEKAIDHTDAITEAETMKAERCLLYVALTRAQKQAFITSFGVPSEFLQSVK